MEALRFDAFTLDVPGGVLLRGDEQLSLRPQSFDVLVHLARRSGQVVTSKELIETFWDPKRANDNSLARCIKDIRDALGDTDHRIVRTVPRRGYLLAPPVSAVPEAAPGLPPDIAPDAPAQITLRLPASGSRLHRALVQRWQVRAALLIVAMATAGGAFWSWVPAGRPAELTMMAVPSVAVLPFGRPGDGSGDGALADEIATQLFRVPRGFKISVRSAATYKDEVADPRKIGREFGVRYIVFGGLRRDGETVRVNAQLIEAETGRQLWAEPFDYPPGEAGAQSRAVGRLARLVSERLLATESRRPLPAEPKAEHYAIVGRALWAGERDAKVTLEAMALFKKGLDLDPSSLPALQGYARAKISAVLDGLVPNDQRSLWLDEAEEAIDRVVAQERRSYGAYRLRGSLLRARKDWEQAIKAFERALDLNSDYPEAHAELGRVKIELGLAHEAATHIEKAITLSPTDSAGLFWWRFWAGQAALHVGDYQTGLNRLLQARQANRANESPMPWLAVAYAGLGQEDRGRALMAEYLRKVPAFTLAAWNQSNRRDNPVVAAQRERIAKMLYELGVPEGEVRTGSMR